MSSCGRPRDFGRRISADRNNFYFVGRSPESSDIGA